MTLGSVRYPEILQTGISDHIVRLTIKIPENLAYFAGHFPGMSLVPGVVQLHWIVQYAMEYFKIPNNITEGNRIKFSKFMRPNDIIQVTLQHTAEKQLIHYRYESDDKPYASGSFTYSKN